MFLGNISLTAQSPKSKDFKLPKAEQSTTTPSTLKDIRSIPRAPKTILENPLQNFRSLNQLTKPIDNQRFINVKTDKTTGLPNWISGKLENAASQRTATLEVRAINYLEAVKAPMRIENPTEEFFVQRVQTDDLGQTHVRMQQQYQGIAVYGSEVIAHEKDGDIYLVNGRHYPTPSLQNISPTIDLQNATSTAKSDVGTFIKLNDEQKKYVAGEQMQSELVIYHLDNNPKNPKLAYHLTVIPNLAERWEYFIDAHSGEVLSKHSSICKIHAHVGNHATHKEHDNCNHDTDEFEFSKNKNHATHENTSANEAVLNGPATANETDLLGVTRTINTYEVDGTFFMYDGSRPMFDPNSDLPSDPKGMIVTVDGLGTYPNNNNFDYSVITSGNNTYNYPAAVSAHYNGGEAYQYFKTTHNRESINGQGGTVISFFNISDEDGSDMDNAFWNGAAMFYGNGNQAFHSPLQRALDVAGHEMSHGVIQGTANLEYQGQSGALNESFADVFGAMIDRDDWQMGEDITSTSFIPTGALRSLSDPNNGGSSLNTPGWQPKTMSEFQNLANTPQQDYGGVHINSGIPNFAYFLFATDIGKDKAELIYYRALDAYLVKSSQFVDLRNAVVQSASDLYGSAEVNAANAAFDAVGIGQGSGGTYQNDVVVNDGDERVLHSDANLENLFISDLAGNVVSTPQLSQSNPTSKPSITDDGEIIVFIDDESNMKFIEIDWDNGTIVEDFLESNPSGEWRNIAISKDGNRIAAVKNFAENTIWVFDFNVGAWNDFELYNPTTSDPNNGGSAVTTGEVQFADAMEFDFTGNYLMYDAFNQVASSLGNNAVEYWDIGFLRVFDDNINNFGDGTIEKLFAGLPSGVSIGNPTFAKNSPYIVAFDFREEGFFSDQYSVLGANIQTGENNTIYDSDIWGYPNFSVDDTKLIYDMEYQGTTVLGVVNVQSDKISGDQASATFLFPNGTIAEKWGTWFATGDRDLISSDEDIALTDLNGRVYPNPFTDNLTLELESTTNELVPIRVFNLLGKEVYSSAVNVSVGKNSFEMPMQNLAKGSYFIQLNMADGNVVVKVAKH